MTKGRHRTDPDMKAIRIGTPPSPEDSSRFIDPKETTESSISEESSSSTFPNSEKSSLGSLVHPSSYPSPEILSPDANPDAVTMFLPIASTADPDPFESDTDHGNSGSLPESSTPSTDPEPDPFWEDNPDYDQLDTTRSRSRAAMWAVSLCAALAVVIVGGAGWAFGTGSASKEPETIYATVTESGEPTATVTLKSQSRVVTKTPKPRVITKTDPQATIFRTLPPVPAQTIFRTPKPKPAVTITKSAKPAPTVTMTTEIEIQVCFEVEDGAVQGEIPCP